MNVLLSEPTAVLVVGSTVDSEGVRAALLDRVASDVTVVGGLGDARETLTSAPVGCVVLAETPTDATPAECCEAFAEYDPALPMVYYADDPAVTELQTVVNAGADGVVDRSAPPERLADRVETVMAEANERRVQREESDAFRRLLSDIHHSIYVKDAEGRHLRLADLPGGIAPEEAHGRTDQELYGVSDPDSEEETFLDDVDILRDGEVVREKDEGQGEVGEKFWVRTTKVPWYADDGSIKGLVGMSIDITELKRAALRLDAMERRVERFTTYLRHDLHNPLQIVSGNVELALETGDVDVLENALDALDRMEEIIEDIDSFAARHTPLSDTVAKTELARLFEDVWEHLATESASLEIDVPPDATITADKPSVRPIVENLLRNAIEHGGDDVTITVGTTPEGGFYVADDGPGIPPDEREKVLEIGYTTAEDGTGTGLSIVRELVEQNSWTIDVIESDAGGARFEIGECHVVADYEALPAGEEVELEHESAVGTLECEPSAVYDPDADRWTITADGGDIWRDTNDFYFVHATVEGPVRIQGRLADLEDTNPYSKAGFMVRDALDDEATYGYIGATPEFGTELLWRYERATHGRSGHFVEPFEAYQWYRLDRVGTTVTVSVSRDGHEWQAVDQRTVALEDPVEVGILSCSVVPGEPNEAVFDSVTVRELLSE